MSDDALASLQRQIDDMAYLLAEMERRIHLASGMMAIVKSYDAKKHVAVVDLGYDSHDIPVCDSGGNVSPLAKGDLVHVYAPSGDMANAYCRAAGYSGQQKPPANDGSKVMSKPGGGQFKSVDGNGAHVVAGSIPQFVLELGGTKYTIKPEALNQA
ncbi:hypothetical protein CCR94_16295 [Rhodoblastus sphagnicola]|uniref:Gp5/Type VI secretion system Vgr protein OB-fold domain-containing protein n=1 Tax=Rhodoblastus sphagnicola TaxID=333368 RepID=A0A2S6N2W8_9HYPH|nr:hypothetical protein [Rhodoblastus sphagnicola]MBB4199055.1 hypothetical protein [Rhodoblastus sphagnicola]PPQ28950.1 hypothetical protein CCR94_16295 [Rhodoblastus sphagnicola]